MGIFLDGRRGPEWMSVLASIPCSLCILDVFYGVVPIYLGSRHLALSRLDWLFYLSALHCHFMAFS